MGCQSIMFEMATFSTSSVSAAVRGGMPVRVCLQGRDLAAEGIVVEECASVSNDLERFFQIRPRYAKYFDIRLGMDGKPDEQDIFRVARACVIVKIGLNGGREKTHMLLHRQMIPNIVLYRICGCF
jgi:hypothetical protein